MFTNAHRECVVYAIIFASTAILVSVFPFLVYAQEEEFEQDATTTEDTVLVEEYINRMPYKTEDLLGDKVIGDFVVGPGKMDITIEPGQTRVVMVTVSNRTGEERLFEIGTEDVSGSNDPSRTVVLLGDDTGPYSLKDYISVEQERFTLPHNKRARIPVTISIPADAEPGGLYGSLLISTVSKEAGKEDVNSTAPKSAVVARIGSLFFITIPGTTMQEGRFTGIATVPPKKFYQEGPIQFGILFENTGSIHLTPSAELRIYNMFQEEVGFLELDLWFVMPNAERLREVTWDRELLFGKYTVTAIVNRGYGGLVDEMSYSFWVLPWKPLAGGFLIIFILVFLIRSFFSTFEFKRKD